MSIPLWAVLLGGAAVMPWGVRLLADHWDRVSRRRTEAVVAQALRQRAEPSDAEKESPLPRASQRDA